MGVTRWSLSALEEHVERHLCFEAGVCIGLWLSLALFGLVQLLRFAL